MSLIAPMSGLTPRDFNGLLQMKQSGLSLVEVKISQVSFVRGVLLNNVILPENTRVICVLRNGKPILDLDAVFLEEQDAVCLITDDECAVRRAFTII